MNFRLLDFLIKKTGVKDTIIQESKHLELDFSRKEDIEFLEILPPIKLPNLISIDLNKLPKDKKHLSYFWNNCFPDKVRVLNFNSFNEECFPIKEYLPELLYI